MARMTEDERIAALEKQKEDIRKKGLALNRKIRGLRSRQRSQADRDRSHIGIVVGLGMIEHAIRNPAPKSAALPAASFSPISKSAPTIGQNSAICSPCGTIPNPLPKLLNNPVKHGRGVLCRLRCIRLVYAIVRFRFCVYDYRTGSLCARLLSEVPPFPHFCGRFWWWQ